MRGLPAPVVRRAVERIRRDLKAREQQRRRRLAEGSALGGGGEEGSGNGCVDVADGSTRGDSCDGGHGGSDCPRGKGEGEEVQKLCNGSSAHNGAAEAAAGGSSTGSAAAAAAVVVACGSGDARVDSVVAEAKAEAGDGDGCAHAGQAVPGRRRQQDEDEDAAEDGGAPTGGEEEDSDKTAAVADGPVTAAGAGAEKEGPAISAAAAAAGEGDAGKGMKEKESLPGTRAGIGLDGAERSLGAAPSLPLQLVTVELSKARAGLGLSEEWSRRVEDKCGERQKQVRKWSMGDMRGMVLVVDFCARCECCIIAGAKRVEVGGFLVSAPPTAPPIVKRVSVLMTVFFYVLLARRSVLCTNGYVYYHIYVVYES